MPALPLPFSERPVAEWISLLQQGSVADDRLRALQAIGHLCSKEELSTHATNALTDTDPTVRALAARLLGKDPSLPNPKLIPYLSALLADEDPDVRFESARTLIRHQKISDAVPVIAAFLKERETHPILIAAILNTLVEADLSDEMLQQFVAPQLLEFLDHDRAEVREAAASAFAKWPKFVAFQLQPVLAALDDEEPVVREKIAIALGQSALKDDSVKKALHLAKEDEDPEVSRVAKDAYQYLFGVG